MAENQVSCYACLRSFPESQVIELGIGTHGKYRDKMRYLCQEVAECEKVYNQRFTPYLESGISSASVDVIHKIIEDAWRRFTERREQCKKS